MNAEPSAIPGVALIIIIVMIICLAAKAIF